jgi:hypothetical protein
MRLEELEQTCQEAAAALVQREGRPVPPSVVLPLPESTRVVSLAGFPDDPGGRFELLSAFAEDEMRPVNAPCYGFVAEAVADVGGGPVGVVVLVFGARGIHPRITAAPIAEDAAMGAFGDAEDLDPRAMPFLAPLQHAADAARPPDLMDTPSGEGD